VEEMKRTKYTAEFREEAVKLKACFDKEFGNPSA
jgi:hypothetical protein